MALLMSIASIMSTGIRFASAAAISGVSCIIWAMFSLAIIMVFTPVGCTVLTRMLCGASQCANERISPTTPCLAAL
jgi:hypothetical protein